MILFAFMMKPPRFAGSDAGHVMQPLG